MEIDPFIGCTKTFNLGLGKVEYSNMYIENIVIGKPLVNPLDLLAKDADDWKINELEKTYFTNERFLPRILVDLGIMKSISEVKRNRKDLWISLDKLDYIEIKVSKRRLYIVVGNAT